MRLHPAPAFRCVKYCKQSPLILYKRQEKAEVCKRNYRKRLNFVKKLQERQLLLLCFLSLLRGNQAIQDLTRMEEASERSSVCCVSGLDSSLLLSESFGPEFKRNWGIPNPSHIWIVTRQIDIFLSMHLFCQDQNKLSMDHGQHGITDREYGMISHLYFLWKKWKSAALGIPCDWAERMACNE